MFKIFALVVLFLFLVSTIGCGGGSNNNSSGSNSQSPTPGQAQNVYSGTTSNGGSFEAIILPDDKLYTIYGTTTGNVFSVEGMLTGQGAVEEWRLYRKRERF